MTHFDISINFRRLHTSKVLRGKSIRKGKMGERKRKEKWAREGERERDREKKENETDRAIRKIERKKMSVVRIAWGLKPMLKSC